MLKELITIANELDKLGLHKEADAIEGMIIKTCEKGSEKKNWIDYIKKPGEKRECLTPDSQFHIHIGEQEVSVSVDLPMKLPDLSEKEMQEMEDAMHDAMEVILAKYFEDKND